ncbi:MAG TPA: ribosome biogenesis GTP-binding protein YihA/YsxC [Candidatus Krumholzibacteria bacterium]|nr:ribosome biogenesis GTP-binding protein YihA/YsxC [Candidatus Krumholzibacteria bacterium]
MQIRSVEFFGSFGYPAGLPDDMRPEVALFGRSNVGKSSLINTLLGRRSEARVSKTPGKTRAANYFKINDRFFLVDMPGYGYAKAPKTERARFQKLFEQYIDADDRRSAMVQLIDARHDPTELDLESIERLHRSRRPMCLVFTKADKVSRGKLDATIARALRGMDVRSNTGVVPFSSVTGQGKRELWGWIESALSL